MSPLFYERLLGEWKIVFRFLNVVMWFFVAFYDWTYEWKTDSKENISPTRIQENQSHSLSLASETQNNPVVNPGYNLSRRRSGGS